LRRFSCNVTASHIHISPTPFAGTGGVATQTPTFSGFPAGGASGTYSNTFDMTLSSSWNAAYITANGGTAATAFAAFVPAIGNGQAYWNIHSSAFGGGEIRGFLVAAAAPEPGTLAFLTLGGVGVFLRKKYCYSKK
jgi:hypothetical protein